MKKRDGSVVNRTQVSENVVFTDSEKVGEMIINHLMKIQKHENEPKYIKTLPFPQLPRLSGTYNKNC